MRLYTKTGDKGDTGLIDGSRVGKDHPRVSAYGDVDELNAAIGLAQAGCGDTAWAGDLHHVEDRLFVLGAQMADPAASSKTPKIGPADIARLEGWIDQASAAVKPLKHFVLPGGCELAARFHVARTVCRRAERSVVSLRRSEAVDENVVVYLNRLSDLLFAWARLANQRAGVEDVIWLPPAP